MHVLVKLLYLVLLVFALSDAKPIQFIGLVTVITGFVFMMYAHDFTRMLSRVKSLLMIMVILYTFSTPGEYMTFLSIPVRPTYEGLLAGLTQMLVIVKMLACLTLVLSTTPRAKLIGGLYQLLSPFKCLGIQAEKFAVRIWLTLHYVDSSHPLMQLKTLDISEALNHHFKNNHSAFQPITIDIEPFKRNDYMLVILAFGMLIWVV